MAIRRVVLAKPRGFCAGVVRAIDIVERALALFPPPIYVFHEIVHNHHIVERLRQRGVVFVDRIADVPEGATCIFSAHGVSPHVRAEAAARKLRVIDATCPLVTKVHVEAVRFAREGYTIVLIGHSGHEEVEGTMGEAPMHLVSSLADVERLPVENPERIVYLTQTTLSVEDTAHIVEALRRRFPHLEAPPKEDICYATQNRQNAVKALAHEVDLILVIGSQNSSNSQRLREVAHAAGVPAYVINDETEIRREWFDAVTSVGVTAGASAPEELVARVIAYLRALGAETVEEMQAEEENVHFALPSEIVRLENPLGGNARVIT